LYVEGYATLEESRLRLDRLTRKRQVLEDEYRTVLARLEGQLADEQRDHLLMRIVEQTRRRLSELSDRERQEVIRAVLDQVSVGVDQTIEDPWLRADAGSRGRPSVPAADGLEAHLSVRRDVIDCVPDFTKSYISEFSGQFGGWWEGQPQVRRRAPTSRSPHFGQARGPPLEDGKFHTASLRQKAQMRIAA